MKTISVQPAVLLAILYVFALWHVQGMVLEDSIPLLDDTHNGCSAQRTEDSCLNVTGCAWCANATNSPGSLSMDGYGVCYHERKGEKCCAVPYEPSPNGNCVNGYPEICASSETCSISTLNTQYGPCYYPACCPPSKPVNCNGQCYVKGTKCCQTTTCKANQSCCDNSFEAGGICCGEDAVCCTEVWNYWCCPKGNKCNYTYLNCTK